jgi:hypothetical protein
MFSEFKKLGPKNNHHPNIYDFMEKIKLIQTYNYLKIRAASLLSTAEKGNLEQMRNIQRQYRNGEVIMHNVVSKSDGTGIIWCARK